MKSFHELVATEIEKARSKHRGIDCEDEGLAVIQEEVEEFAEAVFRDMPSGEALKELVQIAAMCQRFIEDCGILSTPQFEQLVEAAVKRARTDRSNVRSRHSAVTVVLREFRKAEVSVHEDSMPTQEIVGLAAACRRCAEDVPLLLEAGNDGQYAMGQASQY